MKVMTLKAPGGLENFVMLEREQPGKPGPGELLVRMRASSLNYHDYVIAIGQLKTADGRVPMSDGGGEVVEVGAGVKELKPGDRIATTFFPNWLTGDPTSDQIKIMAGDTVDGYAAEYVVLPATAVTKAPPGYSHAEAAALTCAGLTAWRGVVVEGQVKPGDTVLVQGTGGVSIFALQFAKAAGATVIATSSSDEKLERLRGLGADHLINYKQIPEWGKKAKEFTGGRGVDHVIEVGGPGTLTQSIRASRMGGHISLIGVLTGHTGEVPTALLFTLQIKLKGIMVGSRQHQEEMVRAVTANGIKPVIDSTFPLERIAEAYRHQASQKHFGKICLEF